MNCFSSGENPSDIVPQFLETTTRRNYFAAKSAAD
jgi:hypothetical protein